MTTTDIAPRFLYGRRAIRDFLNRYSDQPLNEKQIEKMIARGSIPVGRDGRGIVAEESAVLAARRRIALAK
jgi:hypothetical protein